MHGNCRYGHYKDSMFRSNIEKWKQVFCGRIWDLEISPVPTTMYNYRSHNIGNINILWFWFSSGPVPQPGSKESLTQAHLKTWQTCARQLGSICRSDVLLRHSTISCCWPRVCPQELLVCEHKKTPEYLEHCWLDLLNPGVNVSRVSCSTSVMFSNTRVTNCL